MIRFGCLTLVILFVAIPTIASRFLPWWGVLLLVLGQIVLLVRLLPVLLKLGAERFVKNLIKQKSNTLRGAMVHVHRVELAGSAEPEPPSDRPLLIEPDGTPVEPEDDEEPGGDDRLDAERTPPLRGRLVLVEATITPAKASAGQLPWWDPSDLTLVPFDKRLEVGDAAGESDEAVLQSVQQIDESGRVLENVFGKLAGPARLRMVFDVPPLLHGRAKLRYYFESLGEVMLPVV
jgi:hypothetical protein